MPERTPHFSGCEQPWNSSPLNINNALFFVVNWSSVSIPMSGSPAAPLSAAAFGGVRLGGWAELPLERKLERLKVGADI